MKKNLVMGAVAHYDWNTLEPFVFSCRKNCPSADLLLFVDDISDFARAQLIRGGVFVKDFPDEMKHGIPNNTRWKIFLDFLEVHGDDYSQIFITDTRDVIFQGDVFEKFSGYKNYLGYATEKLLIGEELVYNYYWLIDCFGKEETEKIADKKIICDGTVIGTSYEMKIFSKKMSEYISTVTARVKIRIHDQAIANYIIRNNLLPIENLIEIDVETGEIFTMALTDNFSVSNDKIFRNGSAPTVVHQYDRKESLRKLVNAIYHDKNFRFDECFTDPRSMVEQVTSLLRINRINEATRIFLKNFLAPTDFSYCGRALARLWSISLDKPPSQSLELLGAAAQNAATSSKIFSSDDMQVILSSFKRAKKIGAPVDSEFKKYIAGMLLTAAKNNFDSKDAAECFRHINMIEELDMPPDKDFYLFVAKANRIFGRKDEALAAYKKVLELS